MEEEEFIIDHGNSVANDYDKEFIIDHGPDIKYDNRIQGLDTSKYTSYLGDNIFVPTSGIEGLNVSRASMQPVTHKLGNALGRLTNIIPEAIGSVASALDFEDYWNQDDEVGNWLTDITEEWKQSTNEALPIYRQNPGKSLDFGDSGWWIENGSALVNSIGGFALGGGVITKGLTGLSKLTKAKKLAELMLATDKANRFNRGTQAGITALMMNQSEGILESMSVYDDIYKETLLKLNKEKPPNPDLPGQLEENEAAARQKAADAASATVLAGRLTMPLNLVSAKMFMRVNPSTKKVTKESLRNTFKEAAKESPKESLEEFIMFGATQYGRAKGRDQKYGVAEIIKDLGDPEGQEAALLGLFGGMGQTIVTKEGVNRFKQTVDPVTGEKMSVREYNKQAYNKQKDIIDENESRAKTSQVKGFTNAFNNVAENLKILDAIKKAEAEGNTEEVKRLKDLHLDNTAYYNFQNGTTESLIKLYEELRDGEQKEDMPKDYKELANKAISKIKTLENFYNESGKYNNHQQVYINRANRYDLENYIDEVNVEVGKVSTSLNGFINKISELSTDIKGDVNKSGYFLDINNIDFNPAKEAGDTKAAAELDELKNIVKNSGDYKSLLELKEAKVKLVNELKENLVENTLITSKEYQNNYQEAVNKIRETAESKIDKQVKTVEKEIKKDAVIKKEADRQAEIDAKNAETEQAIADKKAEVAETTDNLNTLADNYNVGEVTDLENIFGEKYKGVSGEILSITENEDGTKTIFAQLDNDTNDIISSDDKVPSNFKNDDIDDVYNTDGSIEENTSNEESVEKAKAEVKKKESVKNKNKYSDVKLMSTYEDSGKTVKGVPQAYVDWEREAINKVGTKVYFEINKQPDNNSSQKADIEKRRQEEIGTKESKSFTDSNGVTWTVTLSKNKDGKITRVRGEKNGEIIGQYENDYKIELPDSKIYEVENADEYKYTDVKQLEVKGKRTDKINAKYDAELAALENDKTDNFSKATKLYNDFMEGKELSKDDKDFMVDYLPFKAKINNSDTVYTFLESKPNYTKNDSLETYNNRTRPLRISLINHLKNGSDIKGLYTTVKFQYGGQIQLDTKGSENNILELDGIDSLEDVELYVIDQYGQLKDISGEHAKDWTKTKKNWKGSIYMKTKLANGNPFYLNLNFGKVSTKQAEIIFEVYRSLLQKGNRPTSLLTNLAPNIQSLIKKNLKKEIDLIKKTENKPFEEIIISELLDLIFWDGSKDVKSKLRVSYETQSIEFGDKSYKLAEFTDDKKSEFVDWVSKNKNRNFKFKPKPSDINQSLNSTGIDYLQYAIDEKVINTNAKVNQPLFEGFTNLYLTNSIAGNTTVTKPKVIVKAPYNKQSEIDKIEAERQAELDNLQQQNNENKTKSFEEAGLEAKSNQDGKILGQWFLDNAKIGDTLSLKDGTGYEVTEIDRRGNVTLTPFDVIKGKKVYDYKATRLISKVKLKQGDLFETSYRDNNDNVITEQYIYTSNNSKDKINAKYDAKIAELNKGAQNKEIIENGSQGDFHKDGYFAFNDNSDHSQDSVKVYNGWAMVADGVSSNKNSKVFADALLNEISKDSVLDTTIIENIIDELARKYSDGAATLAMVKKNPDGTFTYFTLGDSQIIVVDKNGKARQTFAQVDKNGNIDYGNSTHAAVAGHGINGKFQTGKIRLKLGEKIVIASDGIIDVLQYRDGKDKDIVDFYNNITKVFPKNVLITISESSFEEISSQISALVNGDSSSKSKNATAILLSLEKAGLLYDTMLNNPTLINKLALLAKGDDNSFIIIDNNFNSKSTTAKPQTTEKGFRKYTDTNLKFAEVDGKKYYASPDSGRVFVNKALDKVNGRTPYVHEQVGELITDVNLINKIEANIRGNMFAGAPNIKLNKDFSNKSENNDENIRISQNFIVPLQENPLSDEAKTIEDKPLKKKRPPRQKLSKKEAQARALAAANKLNKKCK